MPVWLPTRQPPPRPKEWSAPKPVRMSQRRKRGAWATDAQRQQPLHQRSYSMAWGHRLFCVSATSIQLRATPRGANRIRGTGTKALKLGQYLVTIPALDTRNTKDRSPLSTRTSMVSESIREKNIEIDLWKGGAST